MANTVRLGNFPSNLIAGYGWLSSEFRVMLQKAATWVDSPPRTDVGAVQVAARKTAMLNQLYTLTAFLGAFAMDAVSGFNGKTVTVRNSTTSHSVVATGIGTITATNLPVNLPATTDLVSNGQTLTGVAPSGSYVSTVTFTVAGGVITAIVLS